jgi:hypothetical protein
MKHSIKKFVDTNSYYLQEFSCALSELKHLSQTISTRPPSYSTLTEILRNHRV